MITINDIFKIKEYPTNNKVRNIKYNWKKIWMIPEFAKLEECEQNPKWHSEGNVKKHVMRVCEYAVKKVNSLTYEESLNDTKTLNRGKNFDKYETYYIDSDLFDEALTLLTAALFHDIGKGITTAKGKDGNWHSYNHEFEGEKLTRQLLWNENVKFREDVCSLVKYHMIPLNLFERKNFIEETIKIGFNIPSWKLLLALKYCDLEGSIQKDAVLKERDRRILSEVKSITMEIGVYDFPGGGSVFSHRMHLGEEYLNNEIKKPIHVVMLIGLPGAGKDTFIENNLIIPNKETESLIGMSDISRKNSLAGIMSVKKKNACVISRDIVRAKLGFCKEGEKIVGTSKQENAVNEEIKNELYEAASEGKTIFVSNMNFKKEHRAEIVRLLSNYNVKITYIYIEADDFQKNVERREGQISEGTLYDMIKRLEWPDFFEYDNFYYVRT